MSTSPIGFPSASLQLATTPGDVLYTCPAGTTRAIITKLIFLNTTATARTVTVHVVRSGGSIADNNQVVSAMTVPVETVAPQGVECYGVEGIVLNPGDFIQAFASAGSAITPMGSVTEVYP